MPDVLSARAIGLSGLSAFAAFDCGDSLPAAQAAEWIRKLGAIQSINRGTTIFAYYRGDSLVGFGSLGKTKWSGRELAFIPMLAVAREFQGQPRGEPRSERYCGQIVTDLIERASLLGLPLVGLFCLPENDKAMSLYLELGFVAFPDPGPHGHIRMARRLT